MNKRTFKKISIQLLRNKYYANSAPAVALLNTKYHNKTIVENNWRANKMELERKQSKSPNPNQQRKTF